MMDIDYAKHNDILMDFGIMLKTPVILMQNMLEEEVQETQLNPVQLHAELIKA
jgi:hypothetical protein